MRRNYSKHNQVMKLDTESSARVDGNCVSGACSCSCVSGFVHLSAGLPQKRRRILEALTQSPEIFSFVFQVSVRIDRINTKQMEQLHFRFTGHVYSTNRSHHTHLCFLSCHYKQPLLVSYTLHHLFYPTYNKTYGRGCIGLVLCVLLTSK